MTHHLFGAATEQVHPAGLPEHLRRLNRTLVMGVINVTPDSFSDGGIYAETDLAIARGIELVSQGADIVDIGGESTRPGAERVSLDEEVARTLPVVKALSAQGIAVSIDTMRAQVAQAAVEAGAAIINDVSGGKADSKMFDVVSQTEVPYVLMHWRGHSTQMDALADYQDVTGDVCTELSTQVTQATQLGIDRERLVLDPGIGFAKTGEQNWSLLSHLETMAELGRPLLVGASRKKFLGELLGVAGMPRPVDQRESATTALTALLTVARVWAVRVHDVRASRDAIEVVRRIQEA
mgnify:CR=1 FL=1